jgi:hypothetical protein
METPWGHEARNLAMPRCAGTHLLWIDDDDKYVKGALTTVRQSVRRSRNRVHLFAMAYPNGVVVKPRWPLIMGSVGTPMICVPNEPGKLGRWGDEYEGDYSFVTETMRLRGDKPVLHADVIATIAAK